MARIILIAMVLLMISCSKPDTPEQIVEKLYMTADYKLLSAADKQAMTAEEWDKLGFSRMKPQLAPSSRYFELEQYLYKFTSATIHPHTVDGDKKLVKVTFKYPSLLLELHLFSDTALKLWKEEIEQAQVNFEKGLITESTLNITETEETFTLLADGVFLDLAALQERRRIHKTVHELRASLEPLRALTFKNMLSYHFNGSDYAKAIEETRQRGLQQITSDFEMFRSVFTKMLELDPDSKPFIDLHQASEAYRRLVLLKADNYFKQELAISNTKISDTSRGYKAVFFDWELKSPSQEPLYGAAAAFSATFFDDSGKQIGYQELIFKGAPDGERNMIGSGGLKIDNQTMANKARRVDVKYLFPYSLPMFSCSLDQQLSCGTR
ncbi:hypothetical protein AEST_10160 [Alishewanella aestuarii B11]|uniref:Lipoprotein n=1 Tax=Alishewanella aestuarii B11 TaxID=1197174 RepID=J2IFZ6_9ALTE|nr:hypothetical protein [Alishewanella aestuarii]EJI86142.1 hypothetical protein AEST_10160 [Alishewanella aestuarii B11]